MAIWFFKAGMPFGGESAGVVMTVEAREYFVDALEE